MSHAYPPELQELIDKQAIRDLLAAYFTAADRHDNVKMAALYHDDATDDHGSFFKGLAKDFVATLPNFFSKATVDSWPSWMPKKRIVFPIGLGPWPNWYKGSPRLPDVSRHPHCARSRCGGR